MKVFCTAFSAALLVISATLYAEEENTSINLNSINSHLPSTLVENCVDVASGSYSISDTDFVVKGKEPIILKRTYNTNKTESLYSGWEMRPTYVEMHMIASVEERKLSNKTYTHLKYIVYEDSDGTTLVFKPEQEIRLDVWHENKNHFINAHLDTELTHLEYLSPSHFVGRSNIRNVQVKFHPKDRYVALTDGAGNYKRFDLKPPSQDGKHINHPSNFLYLLSYERKANGNQVFYRYNKDTSKIYSIETKSPTGSLSYAYVTFDSKVNAKEKKVNISIASSDGQTAHYETNDRKLVKASFSHLPAEQFKYIERKSNQDEVLKSRIFPDGRVQRITYCSGLNKMFPSRREIAHAMRVSKLEHSVESTGNTAITHRFDYSLNKDGSPKSTTVTDASGNNTSYYFDKYSRTIKIEYFQLQSNSQHLLHYEVFTYLNDPRNALLLAKSIFDASHRCLASQRFYYDSSGDLIEERFYGNITGTIGKYVELDGQGFPLNTCEHTYKRYKYNKNHLPIQEENSEGFTFEYSYFNDTDQLSSKLTLKEGKILTREFHFYNKDHILIKSIQDDGNSRDPNIISNVTKRLIKVVKPRDGPTFAGLTDSVEEYFFDLSNHQEKLFHKTVFSYDSYGNICQEDHYDSDNVYVYSIIKNHDAKGRLVATSNSEGIITAYQYDNFGNKTRETVDCKGGISNSIIPPRKSIVNTFEYDRANRPIRLVKDSEGLNPEITHYKYDLKGNKISEIDPLGNETLFEYDALNRLTRQIYHTVNDTEGHTSKAEISFVYSPLNKLTTATNALNEIINTEYNVLGNPLKIVHPDGSQESFEYYLNGLLKKSIDQEGNITLYEYDALGRTISKTICYSDNTPFSTETWTYKGSFLSVYVNPDGLRTEYIYNHQGQLIKEIVHCTGEQQVKSYFYDTLGRATHTIHHGLDEDIHTCLVLDLTGRVIEKKILSNNKSLLHEQKRYDIFGNEVEVLIYGDAEIKTSKSEYDSLGRLILKQLPTGEIYRYEHSTISIPRLGQKLATTTTIAPNGVRTIQTHNTQKKLLKQEIYSPYRHILAKEEYTYDVLGRETVKIGYAYHNGHLLRTSETRWEYGSNNKVLSITEACSTSEQTTYRFAYTPKGFVKCVYKPDGVTLHYEYNPIGCKTLIYSSDASCNYTLEYTPAGNLISSQSPFLEQSFKRELDVKGSVLAETFGAKKLKISKGYDALNRPKYLAYPDKSYVEYQFEGIYLSGIRRAGSTGHEAYCYQYSYDLSGDLKKTSLPGDLGEIEYSYEKGRLTAVKSPLVNQEITSFDDNSRPLAVSTAYHGLDKVFDQDYQYDLLGQIAWENSSEKEIENSLLNYTNTYEHDSLNNRLQKNHASCGINTLNQLLSQGETLYRYDSCGNLITKEDSNGLTKYSYDALDRLTQVILPDGSFEVYAYDGIDRRLYKLAYSAATGRKDYFYFLYDGNKEIGCWDIQANRFKELRVLNPQHLSEINATVAIEIGSESYIPVIGALGNPLALYSTRTKELKESYHFDAFGEGYLLDSYGEKSSLESSVSPWGYQGKRLDKATGLVYFGKRYYKPEVGRWISKDPAGYVDGLNLYAYVLNSPLTNYDLYGLSTSNNPAQIYLTLHEYSDNPGLSSFKPSIPSSYSTYMVQTTKTILEDVNGQDRKFAAIKELQARLPQEISVNSDWERENKSRCYVVNAENSLAKGGIGFANGINNSFEESYASAELISKMGGNVSVQGIYNATQGLIKDVHGCHNGLLGRATVKNSLFHRAWDNFFSTAGPNEIFLQIVHSGGAIDVRNALLAYPPELRKRIRIAAFAPGGYIPKDLCHSVTHYVSEKDIVPTMDIAGRCLAMLEGTVVDVTPSEGKNWYGLKDHSFNNPVYKKYMKREIDDYFGMVRSWQ